MEWELTKKGVKRAFYIYVWGITFLILLGVIILIGPSNIDYGIIVGGAVGFFILLIVTFLVRGEYCENWREPIIVKIDDNGLLLIEKFVKRRYIKKRMILWDEIFRVVVSKNKRKIIVLFSSAGKTGYLIFQLSSLDPIGEKKIKEEIIENIIAYAKKKNIEILYENFHLLSPTYVYPRSLIEKPKK